MTGDGIFKYRDGIAVAQIVLFSVSFLCGVYFRYTRRIGWFCIGVFSLIRLVAASCMLGTINIDSSSLHAGVFVCESLGMILIIFLLLEMLEGINKVVPTVHKRVFFIPQLLTWIDIGISIGGYVAVSRKSDNQLAPTPYTRAGMAIIAIIVVYVIGVSILFWFHRATFPSEGQRAVKGVATCVPPMVVRLVYSLIFVGSGDMTFNAINGDSTAYLLMTFLPEVGVIAVCTWTIVKIPPLLVTEEGGMWSECRGTR